MRRLFCAIGLLMLVGIGGQASAKGGYFAAVDPDHPSNVIRLPGSSILILLDDEDAAAASQEQEYGHCLSNDGIEGYDSEDFECRMGNLHWGCSPSCDCCWYEEIDEVEPKDLGLSVKR